MSMVVGRFAPSPSGRIHLGNIFCCLLAWLSARQKGGRVVLRIEDLDTARCPRRYAEQMIEDLRWLGLLWDEGPDVGGPNGPYFQSERTALYQAALERLEEQGLVYPCFCTRAELHAASAPHREDGQVIYPGTCRDLTPAQAAPLLVFCLLYTPCIAAVASVKRELGGKWAAIMVLNQCVTAWLCALVMRLILLAI